MFQETDRAGAFKLTPFSNSNCLFSNFKKFLNRKRLKDIYAYTKPSSETKAMPKLFQSASNNYDSVI